MYVSTPAPHRPATPAPQYANDFSSESAPRTPTYGFQALDKHWILSNGKTIASFYIWNYVIKSGTPPLNPQSAEVIDDLYRDRIRTLESVDDLVEAIVNILTVSIICYQYNYLMDCIVEYWSYK